jgi:UDP-GlcNAc:undecaprenyl-phosphate/decaprenyl-phosphate GlcNAc-1-phosphate transferase
VSFAPSAQAAVPAIFVGFVLAALIAFGLTPAIRTFVRRRGIVDRPDPRRVHRRPLPRGGGIAVVAAFTLVGGVAVMLGGSLPGFAGARPILPNEALGLFVGGLVAATIGAIDDVLDLRARWQLLGQLAVAGVAVAFGITVKFIDNPFDPVNIVFPTPLAIGFTFIWIIGMINSINFIDGLDGLSTGIALVAAVTLGLLSLTTQVGQLGQPFIALLCFVFAGALLGFLRWNFHPAVIFQGTSGVMFLGFTLSVLAILGTAKVIVALLVLGVPIIDTFWVIVRRVSGGRSPFSPDRGHIHHRLLDLGLSHRSTVLLIYAICTTLGVVSLLASAEAVLYAFLGGVVAFGLALFLIARGPSDALESTTYDNGDA